MKTIIVTVGLIAILLLSGCTQPPVSGCGNGTCDNAETELSCAADCAELPPMPNDSTKAGSEETIPALPF